MKHRIELPGALLVVVVMSGFLYGSESTAYKLGREEGQLLKARTHRTWRVPTHFGSRVISMAFVDTAQQELAVVSEKRDPNTGVTERTLSFYGKRGAHWRETYRFITPSALGSMYPLGDDKRLVTTWIAGSASRTAVFYVTSSNVRIVLWLALQQTPDFVDLDGDGETEIVAAVPTFPGQRPPEEADIYRWDGQQYVARRVPWLLRFR